MKALLLIFIIYSGFIFFVPTVLYVFVRILLKTDKNEIKKHIFINIPIRLFCTFLCLAIINIVSDFFLWKIVENFFIEFMIFFYFVIFMLECFLIEHKKQIIIWAVTFISYFTLLIFKKKLDGGNLPSILFPYKYTILAFFLIILAIYGILKIRFFLEHKEDKKYLMKEILKTLFYFFIGFVLAICWSENIFDHFLSIYIFLPFYMNLRFIFIKNRKFTSLKDYFKYVFPILVLIVLIFLGHMNRHDFFKNLSKLNPSHKEQNNEYANFPS